MTTLASAARVRPLSVRPGARYACFGDGPCCTDVHGLGPLNRREVRSLRVIRQSAVASPPDNGFDEPMLRTRDDGRCVFLGDGRCELHAGHGEEAKPDGCRRFPLGLTATPRGGRITTSHRCPCRTLGVRPVLTAASAEPSLRDPAGRLYADHRVSGRVPIAPGRRVGFDQYERIEAGLLGRLAGGEAPARALEAEPFPRLSGRSWSDVAEEMLAQSDEPTRFAAALGWFAESILARERRGYRRRFGERPWAREFDRAEARATEERAPRAMVASFVADAFWAMEWTRDGGSLGRARAELATRVAVVDDVRRRLASRGVRADRATAEAVMIADLVGDAEHWSEVTAAIG